MMGPFRIRKASPESVLRGGSEPSSGTDDHWMQRLTKLIPGEVLAVYLTGKAYAAKWIGTWAAICLILVIIIRIWGTRDPGRSVQWLAVAISSGSFIIWIYAMGDRLWTLALPDPGIASAAVLVWTVFVPIFYKGE